jgi:mRNA-degrading endonuclease HigB of HigAB toxin-antitoxin module
MHRSTAFKFMTKYKLVSMVYFKFIKVFFTHTCDDAELDKK